MDRNQYDMVLIDVDDMLIFAKKSKITKMDKLGKLYEHKPESVKEPDIYLLGDNMEKVQFPNVKVEWGMGSQTYVKNAVKVVKSLIAEDNPEVYRTKPISNWLQA